MTQPYTYDANGYLAAIKIGGQRVWERDSYTGTQRRWALGTQPLYVTRKYSDKGLLTEQEIIRQAGSLHKMTYTFDGATGNLTQRTGMNGTETFKYDQFDRLNTGTSYALNGNIASKTGIGKYTYDTGKKNAVVQVENTSNLIQGAASLTYNAFNKVATVVQGTNTLTITYGPDHQRTKTVLVNGSNTTTTLYADNYEQRTANGVTTTYHYVASPDGLAAVYVKSGSTATAYYIETDHLGSIIRAYDYIGNTKFSAAYDAWGNQTVSTNAIGLTRGYTGHEYWNQFGLIDMNGRFYDPLLGRFLSPDPYVQAPENPQNYNRYAYCLNNPLKYTDPSGKFFLGTTITFVVDLVKTAFFDGGLDPTSKSARRNAWKDFDPTASWSPTNRAWKIDIGSFKTDHNRNFWGRSWQLISRWTWESEQTTLGKGLSHIRNIIGEVDDVSYYGGATLVNKEDNSNSHWGLTLGPYVNSKNVVADPNKDQMFRHEYGHTLQSRLVGPLYTTNVGLFSFIGCGLENIGINNHSEEWYETQANRMSYKYLQKHDPDALTNLSWDDDEDPIDYNTNWYWTISHPTVPFIWWLFF